MAEERIVIRWNAKSGVWEGIHPDGQVIMSGPDPEELRERIFIENEKDGQGWMPVYLETDESISEPEEPGFDVWEVVMEIDYEAPILIGFFDNPKAAEECAQWEKLKDDDYYYSVRIYKRTVKSVFRR